MNLGLGMYREKKGKHQLFFGLRPACAVCQVVLWSFFFSYGHISKPSVAEIVIKSIPRGLHALTVLSVTIIWNLFFSHPVAYCCSLFCMSSWFTWTNFRIAELFSHAEMNRKYHPAPYILCSVFLLLSSTGMAAALLNRLSVIPSAFSFYLMVHVSE